MLALVLDWLGQTWEWIGAAPGATANTIEPNGSSLPTWLRYFALALFVGAGLFGAVKLRRRMPRFVPFFLGIMLAYGTMWVIIGLEPSEYKNALGTSGPLLFVMCLGVYAGLDFALWRRVRPILLVLAYASVGLAAYYTVTLQFSGMLEGPTPINQHVQTGFWLAFAALIIGRSHHWKKNILAVIPIAVCVPIAMLMASRSWTVLTLLALGLGLLITFRERLRLGPAKILLFSVAALVAVLALVGIALLAFPDRMETLTGRLTEDTRTSEYSEFFDQVPVTRLITGLGPKATWGFGNQAEYEYFDNQFLFILFKFGLPVLLGYCAVVIWPGLRLLVSPAGRRDRALGWFFIFWILAALGISVFHGITNNPQNFIAILLAGRCFLLLTSKGKTLKESFQARKRARSLAHRSESAKEAPPLAASAAGEPAQPRRTDSGKHRQRDKATAKLRPAPRVFFLSH
jgi:hypothetical protein